jgi:uncharacterized protein (TIGR02145 family)
MLHDAIYDRLKTVTANVFPGIAPENVKLPYIVFFQISNVPSPDASGASKLDDIRYQVSVFAKTYREMETLAESVRTALDEYKNTYELTVKNGRLYNFYALDGLAPAGWHVATDADYTTLSTYLGGSSVAGGKLKQTGTEFWSTPNTGATNEVNFSALGSGLRNENGTFTTVDSEGAAIPSILNRTIYWTSTQNPISSGSYMYYILHNAPGFAKVSVSRKSGYSVRLVRDSATGWVAGSTVTDIDGNVYDTVQIGTQIWTAQNFAAAKLANGTPIANVTIAAAWEVLTTGAYCDYDNDVSNSIAVLWMLERSSFIGENYIPEGTGVHHKALDYKLTIKR